MSLNRYRLKHLKGTGHRGARRALSLLKRPDRLIGLILIGNNLVNILASAIATVIAIRLFGDAGIAIATLALTLVILIFAEITPKTIAALHPERVAFPASLILVPLLKGLMPLVLSINWLTNGILKLMGFSPDTAGDDAVSQEELRTIVTESAPMIPGRHSLPCLSVHYQLCGAGAGRASGSAGHPAVQTIAATSQSRSHSKTTAARGRFVFVF